MCIRDRGVFGGVVRLTLAGHYGSGFFIPNNADGSAVNADVIFVGNADSDTKIGNS